MSDRIFIMGVNPGRLKEKIEVNLKCPRTLDTMLTPEFINLNRQVFELIRKETMKNMELE